MRVVPVKKLEGYSFRDLDSDDKVADDDLEENDKKDAEDVMHHANIKSDDDSNVVESDEEVYELEVKKTVAVKKVVAKKTPKP